jgi:2-polyprenyl-6-methoxyphenol hydroxylase-like FAD-dependent oxidoreductase
MKVIIVGAGISGLTRGVALSQLAPRIDVEIFERDAAVARRKGCAIGLKGDARLEVRERLGLRNHVLTTDAQHVTSFVITDRGGRTLLTLPSRGEARRQTYRVQRDRLQSVLIDALITTPLRYGFQALGSEAMDTRYRVIFTAGRQVDGDADRLAARIATRGRKAVLASRRAARQFHTTSRFQIMNRNLGFRAANAMINSRLVRRKAQAPTSLER